MYTAEKPLIARYALFAGVVASAGIPLYVHLPAYMAQRYGIGLETLGALLLALRLIDFVQDPALGWLLARSGARRGVLIATGVLALAFGMVGVFYIAAPFWPILWLTMCLILTFTGYSLLAILVYSDGVSRGQRRGHVELAMWREGGTLIGITAACVLPFILSNNGYGGYALIFAALLLIAHWAMRGDWMPAVADVMPIRKVLQTPEIARFLALAFLNALPVAVTSTLFVFFVDFRLNLPGQAGLFLVVFFLSAAASTPIWRLVAKTLGLVNALTIGMVLAIASFIWAYLLGAGDFAAFVLVCAASGAALGADMVLLPALFAKRQAELGSNPALGFGFWNFASKASLAVSAGVVLPLLSMSGFTPTIGNSPEALASLGVLYALVPCGLKVAAIVMLRILNRHQQAPVARA